MTFNANTRLGTLLGILFVASNLHAADLTAETIKGSINRGMKYLEGKAATGGSQYSDYVVFCGQFVEQEFPEYKAIIDPYKKWIIEHDRANTNGPSLYHSACHVMALDVIGQTQQARDIFAQLKPSANNGQWKVTYHLGWDLYGCIVSEDDKLTNQTYDHIVKDITEQSHVHQYFTAYCLLKAYNRTKDERYKTTYLATMQKLKKFQDQYYQMAVNDGHVGMVLDDFCRAYTLTKDAEYQRIAAKLAGLLINSQATDGSWNTQIAYTIMPVEGLAAYLKYCQSAN